MQSLKQVGLCRPT